MGTFNHFFFITANMTTKSALFTYFYHLNYELDSVDRCDL